MSRFHGERPNLVISDRISLNPMYRISMIEKVPHGDGRIEVIPCDRTVELVALEMSDMGLSYPLCEDDGDIILDRFTDMDAEIGQIENVGRFTAEYDEQVTRAVDEFNLDDDEYIDYGSLNIRLKRILDSMDAGTFVPSVKSRGSGRLF